MISINLKFNRFIFYLTEFIKPLLICLLICISSLLVKAQNQEYKSTFTDAEYYFLLQDYKEALPLYLKLYDQNRLNANINYRIGLCYLNIPGLKEKSIQFLEEAVKKTSPKYQEGSYKEQNAPTNSVFYLGNAYMVNNQLNKAIDTYIKFRDQLDVKDIYNLDFVDQQIKACELAQEMMTDPLKINTERVDKFNETGKYSYNPTLSGNGRSIVFTAKEKFYDGIFYNRKVNGNWKRPDNITLDLGVEGEVYSTFLNHDGTKMLLFMSDRNDGNLFVSNLQDGKWSKAKKLGKNINSKDWETFASFSPDDSTIYFTSTRKGGFGGLDIYTSKLQSNGEWGIPANLGNVINTPYNEESPILSADGGTLYFSSQGHNSMGGFDIFYTKRLNDNSWSTPVNIGYPINTTDDDLFYFPIDSVNALMSLTSKDKPGIREICQVQIVKEVKIPEVLIKGKMLVADNREIESDSFSIKVIDSKSGSQLSTLKPKSVSGEFSVSLKPGNYNVEFKGSGYDTQTRNLYIPDSYSFKEMPFEVSLIPTGIATGEFVTIKSIKFDFDSYALNREALFEIEKVYQLMYNNPSLYIEVTGHTDSKGPVAYNEKLSLKRARAVIEYLVSKSISENRFVARGVGIADNIALNTNPDGSDNPIGRSLNRRVCMKVIKSDKNIQINEDIEVPEHLQVRSQNCTILLAPKGTSVDPKLIENIQNITGQKVKSIEMGIDKLLTLGNFPSKSGAIALLNKCIDNGFPESMIVGVSEIEQQINSNKENGSIKNAVYTIQIIALRKPADKALFKGLSVKEFKGEDGFFRYIHGEFKSLNEAKLELEKIVEMGYPDAFVINLDKYKK